MMIVGLSPRLSLIIQDIISSATFPALDLLGLKGFQFHCKLLELVSDVKQTLLFEYYLLHC